MKKLVFLFAMVFIVSLGYAQTTVINQTNTNEGNGGNNHTAVNQTGATNLVRIDQVQDIQGDPGGVAEITATVNQSGADNTVKISQTHDGTKNNGVSPLTVTATQNGGKDNLITQIQEAGGGNWGNVVF